MQLYFEIHLRETDKDTREMTRKCYSDGNCLTFHVEKRGKYELEKENGCANLITPLHPLASPFGHSVELKEFSILKIQ